jgi:hypothetical protein
MAESALPLSPFVEHPYDYGLKLQGHHAISVEFAGEVSNQLSVQ